MIQDQLVEYVSSQVKLGISRDAIKSALVGAGWKAEDVEDTLKKVQDEKPQSAEKPASQPVASNASVTTTGSPFASFSPSDIVGVVKNAVSQPAAAPATTDVSSRSFFDKKNFSAKPSVAETGQASKSDVAFKMSSDASEYPPKEKSNKAVTIIEAVIILGLAALSCFLYLQNNALNARVSGLGGENATVTSQVSSLNTQAQTLVGLKDSLTAQVSSLIAENQNLKTSLSFFVVPLVGVPGSSSTVSAVASTTTGTVSGILSHGANGTYTLTTPYGVKVSIKNSSDKRVIAVLTPLVGNTVQITGSYLQGTASFTVTDVNGSPLAQNPPTTPVMPVVGGQPLPSTTNP